MEAFLRTSLHWPRVCLAVCVSVSVPASSFALSRFSLSNPDGGQLVRDSSEAEAAHAFSRASHLSLSSLSPSLASQARAPRQTRVATQLKLYYLAGRSAAQDKARKLNVLTVQNVQKMAALEEELLSLPSWNSVCYREAGRAECATVLSALPYLRHATDTPSLHAAIDRMYEELDGGDALGEVNAGWFFEQQRPDGAPPRSRYESYALRSFVRLGTPLEGFLNAEDRSGKQDAWRMEMFLAPAEAVLRRTTREWDDARAASGADDAVGLLFAEQALYQAEYTQIIANDLLLTAGSAAAVFLVLWAYSSSAVLAILGLMQIVLSFPVAMFVYIVLFQIKLFGVLQVTAIFVLLGIGVPRARASPPCAPHLPRHARHHVLVHRPRAQALTTFSSSPAR